MVQSHNPKPPDEQPPVPSLRVSPFWWVVLIGLMIRNAILYFRSAFTHGEIHYSTFIDRVQAGVTEVSGVEMAVLEIDGSISVVPVGEATMRTKKPIKFLRHQ